MKIKKKRGRPSFTKDGIRNPAIKRIRKYWYGLENVFKSEPKILEDLLVERFGKAWLEMNGWDYVWWFGEHDNIRRIEKERMYISHCFDYYAEKGNETWFIDATKSPTRNLNTAVIEPYLRRHKIGFLFVLPNAQKVIFREINKVTGGINVRFWHLGFVRKKDGRPPLKKCLEIVDDENLPDLNALKGEYL